MIERPLYMDRIRLFIDTDLVKVITGIRRCGKSVMLELIKRELGSRGIGAERFISFNFEDLRNAHLLDARSLHDEILRLSRGIDGKAYLFFDEIQEVTDWEKCVNSLRVALDCDIYITGSNAKLLSGELATYLGGRYVEFVIYPFSFAEFLTLYRESRPTVTERDGFRSYITLGGMPYLANLRFAEGPSAQYLVDIFNSVMLKDVVSRNNVRDVDLLERIVTYAMANVGMPFSATSLVKYLKNDHRTVSVDTVLNYLRYCRDAFLLYQVKREDVRTKQALASTEKYYLADHGIREATIGSNTRDINAVLENIVYLELLRRGFCVTVGKVAEKEIDFVCAKHGQRMYVQVTYLLASEETIRREFDVFGSVNDNYPKYVVSLDEFDMSRDGVIHRNIRDFLLAEDWG